MRELERSVQQRIGAVIRAYEEQGFHRTGTDVDRISGDWLADEVRQIGLEPALEEFSLSRVDPVGASLVVNGRTIEGLPLFDGGFTSPAGIAGALGSLEQRCADRACRNCAERRRGRCVGRRAPAKSASGHRRRHARARVPDFARAMPTAFCVPSGRRCCRSPARKRLSLPIARDRARRPLLTAHAERTQAQAFNVVTSVSGTDKSLAPLVVMTPRSGWWCCASERGGGLACWLEIMRAVRDAKPARDVLFVASSGHELGHLGPRCLHRAPAGTRAGGESVDSSRRQHRRGAGARQSSCRPPTTRWKR